MIAVLLIGCVYACVYVSIRFSCRCQSDACFDSYRCQSDGCLDSCRCQSDSCFNRREFRECHQFVPWREIRAQCCRGTNLPLRTSAELPCQLEAMHVFNAHEISRLSCRRTISFLVAVLGMPRFCVESISLTDSLNISAFIFQSFLAPLLASFLPAGSPAPQLWPGRI